jgi:hypothetical protein
MHKEELLRPNDRDLHPGPDRVVLDKISRQEKARP